MISDKMTEGQYWSILDKVAMLHPTTTEELDKAIPAQLVGGFLEEAANLAADLLGKGYPPYVVRGLLEVCCD